MVLIYSSNDLWLHLSVKTENKRFNPQAAHLWCDVYFPLKRIISELVYEFIFARGAQYVEVNGLSIGLF